MEHLHVYRAPAQPATRYLVDFGEGLRHWMKTKPRVLIFCCECDQRHRAENMVVRVYYDCHRYSCAPEKGCKAPGWKKPRRRSR